MDAMQDGTPTDLRQLSAEGSQGAAALTAVLEKLTEAEAEVDRIEAALKIAKARRDEIESVAVESIATSGLDGVKAAGRSWWIQREPHVSVRADKRDAVLEKAGEAGITHLVRTVATSGLKAWIRERAKEAGVSVEDALAATPFAGLVEVYSENSLRSRRAQ